MASNQDQVPDVGEASHELPRDEHGIAPVEAVREQERSSAQAQVPERHGDDGPAPTLGRQPLNEEAAEEEALSGEPDGEPGGLDGIRIEHQASSVTTYRMR